MKKIIAKIIVCISIIFCMMPDVLNAQNNKSILMPGYDNQPYHFGFILGYNQMLLSGNSNDGTYNIAPAGGFSVGVVGNMRINKYFDLRLIPTFSIGERKLSNIGTDLDPYPTPSIIELPLQIKYKSKRNYNTSAYIIAGANYKFDMDSHKDYIDNENNPMTLILRRNDIAAEIGAGFDFYTGFFKLGIEVKMSYGLINLIYDDFINSEYTNMFDKLRSKTFQLSLTFE